MRKIKISLFCGSCIGFIYCQDVLAPLKIRSLSIPNICRIHLYHLYHLSSIQNPLTSSGVLPMEAPPTPLLSVSSRTFLHSFLLKRSALKCLVQYGRMASLTTYFCNYHFQHSSGILMKVFGRRVVSGLDAPASSQQSSSVSRNYSSHLMLQLNVTAMIDVDAHALAKRLLRTCFVYEVRLDQETWSTSVSTSFSG